MSARLRVAVAVGIAVACSDARADEPIRHVVKANETCAAIAQRYYGDARLVDLLHRANPELGSKPPPHSLREGMVLVVPAATAKPGAPDAQLTTVKNQVEVLAPETRPGKPNDPLFRGNRVSTQAASAADVTFRDETQVKLGERTLVIILGDARSAASKVDAGETQTTLLTGNLRAFMSGAKGPTSRSAIATDSANVRVFSGEAQVSADQVKTTRLAVYAGSSTIDARGKTREVARGFGSKAELGKPPTVPRPLPPPPVWTTDPTLVVIDDGAASLVGAYDVPVVTEQKIAEWHLQIARDGIFRDVVADAVVPVAIKRVEAQAPGPGRYYLRVSAIDDDHFEGPFSRTVRVMVVRARSAPAGAGRRRIAVEPADAYCVRVGNVALTRVTAPFEALVGEPVRLRCAPNESDPTTLVPVD